MKFTCKKTDLSKALQHVVRIVSSRINMPILSNILIETDKKYIRLSSTDLELAITTYFKADIQNEGSFTVPAKLFMDFVTQNSDEEIEFELIGFELNCKSEKVQGKITGIDAGDYPELPKVKKQSEVKLPLGQFVDALKHVIIACATDSARPVLNAVYMQLIESKAVFVATDSFRLVEKGIDIIPVQNNMNLLMPMRTTQEIIKIAPAYTPDTDVIMEMNENQILVKIGEVEIFSRLIDGTFPKYQAIIPKKFEVEMEVTTSELIQALRLTNIFAISGMANVVLEINEAGEFNVFSHGSNRGGSTNKVYGVVKEGYIPIRVAFNTKYLLDACSACGTQHLKLKFSGKNTALVIETEIKDYLQLVMPIRIDV